MGKNLTEELKKKKHQKMKYAMKSILERDNLPAELYYKLEEYLEKNKSLTQIYYESNPNMTRHFVYTIDCEYGERLEINITEKRDTHFYNEKPETTIYIENFLTKYIDNKCVTERTLAVNNPEKIISGRLYHDVSETIHEYANSQMQKIPYTEEEIKFIKNLKFVNSKSRVLKTAIENDFCYTLHFLYPNEDYVSFTVGKDSDVFDYIFVLTTKNGRTAVIEGNNKEAFIKCCVTEERKLIIPYEEFAYYNKTIASKLQIILNELRKQGVEIQETNGITRTRENTNN